MPQSRFKMRIVIFLFDELVHAQRLADDFILGEIAASLHLLADETFLMRSERNSHRDKLWLVTSPRKSEQNNQSRLVGCKAVLKSPQSRRMNAEDQLILRSS